MTVLEIKHCFSIVWPKSSFILLYTNLSGIKKTSLRNMQKCLYLDTVLIFVKSTILSTHNHCFINKKNIRKTCPCNVYPLEPHFYIVKLGFAGVYLFFLFLLQDIDCGYSLEPPLKFTHTLCFGAKLRQIGIPCILQVCYLDVGFKKVYSTRTCFRDI